MDMELYNTISHLASHCVCIRHAPRMKYCNLIGAATIVAVTQVSATRDCHPDPCATPDK